MADRQQILDGPVAVFAARDCDTFRWRVRHDGREQSVYVEIAWALRAEAVEEPLRRALESKGEAPLLELLDGEVVPARIKLTASGIFAVDADGHERLIG